MTYREVSTKGTIPASPWPMPGVSTMIRSNPEILIAAIISLNLSGISTVASRVAIERMNILE